MRMGTCRRGAALAATLFFGLAASGASAQELERAVRAGDLTKAQSLIEKDPGLLNAANEAGETILFVAVSNRQIALVEYLVGRGADVNVRTNSLMTPLLAACRRGLPLAIVKLLVEKGADVNAASKYQGRPLDPALENGDAAIIDLLTSRGATATPAEFEIVKLSAHLHRFAYPWGMRNNLVVFDGPDGILVVDTGFNTRSLEVFKRAVAGFAAGAFRYVVNTHTDWDHVAGNKVLAPSTEAVIDAAKLGRGEPKGLAAMSDKPLTGRSGLTLPAPYVMAFNGEEIHLVSYPGLHSPVDLLIHFPKAGVVCMGDLLLSQSCPAVDDARGYLELLDKVLDVFPPTTTFVSGHGRDLKSAELKKYRDDLAAMIEIVKKEFASGKTAADMVKADILKAFKPDYSQLDWLGPDSWVRTVARGHSRGK